MRPSDLARPYGLSSQAIRNYEDQGILPPADRSPGGHRRYTEQHRAALAAFLALVPAVGHAAGAELVRLARRNRTDEVLQQLEDCIARLSRDRATLDLVSRAITELTADESVDATSGPWSIGAVAHQLRLRPATLRAWQVAGVLRPARDPRTGFRSYSADDVRDAHLAQQLRRGGYRLAQIAAVVSELRERRGRVELERALQDWQQALLRRGTALLQGVAALSALMSATVHDQ